VYAWWGGLVETGRGWVRRGGGALILVKGLWRSLPEGNGRIISGTEQEDSLDDIGIGHALPL